MKGVLIHKKVGFKPLADDSQLMDGMEEKKVDPPTPLPSPSSGAPDPVCSIGKTGGHKSSIKQPQTPSTISPASSAESTSPMAASLQQKNSTAIDGGKHHNINGMSTVGFRKTFRLPFWNRCRNGSVAISVSSHGGNSEDEELVKAGESDDPVMDVFQSRYKNRVRWSLDEQPDAEQNCTKKKAAESSNEPEGATPDDNRHQDHDALGTLDKATVLSSGGSKHGNNSNSSSIKKFVTGALFGGGGCHKEASDKEFQKEVKRAQSAVEAEEDLVWESNDASTVGGEVLYTSQRKPSVQQSQQEQAQLTFSFTEDSHARASAQKLIKKARRAQSVYYRYEYAVNCFVRALEILTAAKYPDLHPTVRKTLESLNEAHHKLSSFNNSANIVKIGIKYEDSGELVRALKMYSIAYRIRRDNLSRTHPSLVVLLNMIGSIQTKRGEYEEAMQIYELALRDPEKDPAPEEHAIIPASTPIGTSSAMSQTLHDLVDDESVLPPPAPPSYDHFSTRGNLLAKSVTYREMGTIFEKWDRREEALKMYHLSLDCVAEWKISAGVSAAEKGLRLGLHHNHTDLSTDNEQEVAKKSSKDASQKVMDNVQVKKSTPDRDDHESVEKGEIEIMVAHALSSNAEDGVASAFLGTVCYYDSFFPPHLEKINARKGRSTAEAAATASGDTEGLDSRDDYADIDVALTIHQIAQLFRKQGQFNKALEAYAVALRGMKYSLGNYHPNVAAILGNFGNLQKEMGDLDAAYDTYQEVLGIESYRLGLSHPDVAITLHNIATIDAARGNYERALRLYEQVLCLQQKLFGHEHISIAVTSACMGDVYEALGRMKDAFESYEDALRIKSSFQGPHTLEVARIFHKLAKVALQRGDHRLASSYISRAIFVYRLNKIPDDHQWVIDAQRDSADVDALLALTRKITFEC
jgi:tetratricopeptide (TPR) repeat protein